LGFRVWVWGFRQVSGFEACYSGINSSRRGLVGGERVVVENCGGWWAEWAR